MIQTNNIYEENCLETISRMPDEFVDLIVTSPPYWGLRDYGVDGQLGLESTFQEYINKLMGVFDDAKRVLKNSGSIWVNLGDTYSGGDGSNRNGMGSGTVKQKKGVNRESTDSFNHTLISKTLTGIPERFVIAMTDAGWIRRNTIIWYKPSCMPSSATDRFTVDFEYFYFFTKKPDYYFEQQHEKSVDPESYKGLRPRKAHTMSTHDKKNYAFAGSVDDNGMLKNAGKTYPERNKRCVWTINTEPFSKAHFATFPPALIETPIKACCPKDGLIYDPFSGAGTTALVALRNNRNFIGSELSKEYCEIANKRIWQESKQSKFDL